MKYLAEIDKALEDALRDDWMDDSEWALVRQLMHSHPDWNLEKLEQDIEIGIKNGYTLEEQMKICVELLKEMKDNELK